MKRYTGRVRLYACIAAANHGTTLNRVLSESRSRAEVYARREVMHRLHAEGASYSQIGRWLNRDHSTVMVGLGVVKKHYESRRRA